MANYPCAGAIIFESNYLFYSVKYVPAKQESQVIVEVILLTKFSK